MHKATARFRIRTEFSINYGGVTGRFAVFCGRFAVLLLFSAVVLVVCWWFISSFGGLLVVLVVI